MRRSVGWWARVVLVVAAIAGAVVAWPARRLVAAQAQPQPRFTQGLPAALSDREFWQLIEDSSEPGGYFQSDNLVGNERPLQFIIPTLRGTLPRGGAYLGVAPDQNFTYIVALEPEIAFIVDIRRGNLLEHLMYKALLELSPTRADFLSRLFSRPRPEGLDEVTSVGALLDAYWSQPASEVLFADNLKAITDRLTKDHGFPLTTEDLASLGSIYRMFGRYGPALKYSIDSGFMRNMPDYADMMTATDREGQPRSYLATEGHYRALKAFQEKNLLVPVVGDFAGPKALRAVGAYLRAHGAVVRAFYTSNVEQYLFRNAVAEPFYENVGTLPIDDQSVFLRSASQRNVVDPIGDLLEAFRAGHIKIYGDVTIRGSDR